MSFRSRIFVQSYLKFQARIGASLLAAAVSFATYYYAHIYYAFLDLLEVLHIREERGGHRLLEVRVKMETADWRNTE
jgi:hypothetical protein